MNTMDIRGILEHLPHRYPMLLVDRVLDIDTSSHIHALKERVDQRTVLQRPPAPSGDAGRADRRELAQAAAILSFRMIGISPTTKSVRRHRRRGSSGW